MKLLTPIIEKININKEHTSSTLVIDGIEAIKAITTNFIPSLFEITLSGLKALNALKAFKAYSEFMSTFAS